LLHPQSGSASGFINLIQNHLTFIFEKIVSLNFEFQ
jgi:hypothetical protein